MEFQYQELIERTFTVESHNSAGEFLCKCPFHDDRGRPNLYANAKSGLYICHACSAKGHVGYAEQRPIDLQRRIRKLRTAEEERPIKVFPESWLNKYDGDQSYWTEERGLKPSTANKFRLGYDPLSDAATIPIRSRHGDCHGVIKRRLEEFARPKYLDPKGVPKGKFLWGAWEIRGQKKVALTEGPIDALSLWDAGVPALALMGARITDDQLVTLHLLGIEHVVIMTDRDGAGRNAVIQIREQARGLAISVGVYRYYWTGKDPDELTRSQRKKMFHSAKRLVA